MRFKVGDKVRIKTEEEFAEEFGVLWRSHANWNNEGEMDYLFGKELVIEEINIKKRWIQDVHGWIITMDMLTDIKQPTYQELVDELELAENEVDRIRELLDEHTQLYYIKSASKYRGAGYLNLETAKGDYFLSSSDNSTSFKTKFTLEEIKNIDMTGLIKIKVGEEDEKIS